MASWSKWRPMESWPSGAGVDLRSRWQGVNRKRGIPAYLDLPARDGYERACQSGQALMPPALGRKPFELGLPFLATKLRQVRYLN
jgi:hypothetical protein